MYSMKLNFVFLLRRKQLNVCEATLLLVIACQAFGFVPPPAKNTKPEAAVAPAIIPEVMPEAPRSSWPKKLPLQLLSPQDSA